ncbi:MAG: hypothetical protein IKR00_03630 [Lachnospiraceae bacterium]|nr:hypothetical protein [Lachnospiraceae bacterium]
MMTEWEAVQKRISCRSYEDRLIDPEILQKLMEFVDQLNEESGLHFQLFSSNEQAKPAVKMAAAMFSGPVYTFAALVGGEDPLSSEKVGYYGQRLVLYATQLGLGTCWVAGTYDKKSITVDVPEGERLWDGVPIGYATEKIPLKQKTIRKMIRRSDRKLKQFLEADIEYDAAPEWIKKGVEAVLLGPSAVNQQPVNIVYKDGKVSARIWKKGNGLEHNDLGIAKKQFEAGAAYAGVNGHFLPGDGAEFIID